MYQPNFSNKAFRKRALKAIEFCETYLRPNKAQWLSSLYLRRPEVFGSNEIGTYLKHRLLICVMKGYRVSKENSKGKCKEYVLNLDGLNELKQGLGLVTQTNRQSILHPKIQKHLNEFESGIFKTTTKHHREIHPCQNIPSLIRELAMSEVGYRYNSDIEAAAPTLLYQHARLKCSLRQELPAIEYLLTNKNQVRQRLCRLLDINADSDRKAVKRILTGMFMGMYISKRWDSDCAQLLSHRTVLIERLQKDLYIQRLRKEIRIMWSSIRTHRGLTTRLNPKLKADIYFELEREVREVAKRYCKSNEIKFYPEHDGWRTNEIYDVGYLESLIKIQTGYQVRIDWTRCVTNKT